jgi:hypothetical protein
MAYPKAKRYAIRPVGIGETMYIDSRDGERYAAEAFAKLIGLPVCTYTVPPKEGWAGELTIGTGKTFYVYEDQGE